MSERKISSILKRLGYRAKHGRRKGRNVYTSKSTEKYIHGNLYALMNKEGKQKLIYSMDFTEERVNGKKIYTCGVIDVNGKILVGYAFGSKCTAQLGITALQNAIENYGVPYMVMTDRGSQFTSKEFYDIMQGYGILHSMSRPHTPIDNRYIETFWKSMKVEIGNTKHLTQEMYKMVVEYYFYYYNNKRPHSTLNYLTPMEYYFQNNVI